MDYSDALEAAGCEVLEYKTFGSYQGDWWAIVRHEGAVKVIGGSYGSCSGCDALEAEFGYFGHDHGEKYFYDFNIHTVDAACATCLDIANRFVRFGKRYVDDALTPEEAVKQVARYADWGGADEEQVAWLKLQGTKYDIPFVWPDTPLCTRCGKRNAKIGSEECSECDFDWK